MLKWEIKMRIKTLFLKLFLFLIPLITIALEPPRPGEIEKLKKSGEFLKRLEFAKKLGNHKLKLKGRGEKLSDIKGLPTTGNPQIFVLLIDFPDHPHSISETVIKEMVFGEGNPGNFPYESLKNYYQRSSYGKLNISGDLFGWYRAKYNRDHYTDKAEELIEEALDYYRSQGFSFAKYDNDGDSIIDYFAVFWTGPDTGWGSFWWGWQGYFYDPDYTIDGKKLGDFSWQWEEDHPGTIIHETGHALGLPDYYDYDDSIGPKGGMGGLDMMDAGWGDHNAFSKWMLGWLTPEVVLNEKRITLRPLSLYGDAVVIGKGLKDSSDWGAEYFIIQNRQRIANDSDFGGEGFLILHVDARRDCDEYTLFDNSFTEHKLLRVMEADGLEEIEKGRWGDEGDFYFKGNNDSFTPITFPSSDSYDGTSSYVFITEISEKKSEMEALFSFKSLIELSSPEITYPSDEESLNSTTPQIEWNVVSGSNDYYLEIHEGPNTIYKSQTISGSTFTIPYGKMREKTSYSIWLKAKGDGITYGSSKFRKVNIVITCNEQPFFISKTFFDPPCSSYYGGIAYDPLKKVAVKFGGNTSSKVVEYDGFQFKIYESYPAPQGRYFPALAYDPVNKKIFLFGGYDYYNDIEYNDLWLYDVETHSWKQVFPDTLPPPSWAYRATTDFSRNVVVLHSPQGTWEWDGNNFRLTSTSQPKYYYGNLTYDFNLKKVVYFGGYDYYRNTCSNDTYLYDGQNWTKLNTSIRPSKRCDVLLIFNPNINKTLLFGGSDEYYNLFNDVWVFDGENWSKLDVCGRIPPGYYYIEGYFDDFRKRVVMTKASSESALYEIVERNVACSYTLSPKSFSFSSSGGNGSFHILTEENCSYRVVSDSEWIVLKSPTDGKGSSTIYFDVLPNSGDQRTGKIYVEAEYVEVVQEGIKVNFSVIFLTNPFRIKVKTDKPYFGAESKVYVVKPDGTEILWEKYKVVNEYLMKVKGGKSLKEILGGDTSKIEVSLSDGNLYLKIKS